MPPTPPTPPALPSLDERVELDRMRQFFAHARGNMASMLFGAGVVTAFLGYCGTPRTHIGLWWATFLVGLWVALALERRARRDGLERGNAGALFRQRRAVGGLLSLLYGVSGLMLPDTTSLAVDTLLFVALSAVVALGALSYIAMPSHHRLISLTCFGPLVLHYLRRWHDLDDPSYLLLACATVIWVTLLVVKARAASSSAIQALRLNQQLHDEIAGHEQTREALRQMALKDGLTELGNRRYLDEVLQRAIATGRRESRRFGLLAIDLDDFKPVNDRHGHAVGDELLRAVAERLRAATRSGDFCARMGGDEFSLIVTGVRSVADLHDVASKLRERLAAPYRISTGEARCPASLGWALYPDDGRDAHELMARADRRMYQDKAQGGRRLPPTERTAPPAA